MTGGEEDEAELDSVKLKDEAKFDSLKSLAAKDYRGRRRLRAEFIMVPSVWEKRLSKATRASTFKVALQLLYLDRKERHMQRAGWKKSEPPVVKLANAGLIKQGVTRWQKYRALRELETLGLIKTETRSRKSPRVRLLHMASVVRNL